MVAAIVDDDDAGDPRASAVALAQLDRARRSRRATEVDRFEALYRAYVTALAAGTIAVFVSGAVGDTPATASQVAWVTAHGAAVAGLAISALLALALRSGARGGPLVLQSAEVRHVLLAPVPRDLVLRRPARRQIRFGAFVGLSVGALVGLQGAQRLSGTVLVWALAGAAAGLCTALLVVGAALTAGGLRFPRVVSGVLGLAGLAWSIADVATGAQTSPMTRLGSIALWPMHFDPLAIPAMAIPVLLALAGVAVIGGLSLEAAEHRAALVSQIRFAVTLQDLRAVMLLRRQLAQEEPRLRRVRGPSLARGRRPIWRRDLVHGLRWPLATMGRLVGASLIAGAALVGVWVGTTPLIVVATLALFVAALEVLEPLAEDIDHPDVVASAPVEPGRVRLAHVPVGLGLMLVVCAIGWGGALGMVRLAQGDLSVAVPLGAVLIVPAALMAVVGAATSIVMGPPSAPVALPAELLSSYLLQRALWPVILVFLGLTPLLAAHGGLGSGPPSTRALSAVTTPVMASVLAFAWLRHREQIHASTKKPAA